MNVVITGASRGIGKAIAEQFAAHGHHLFLNARTESTLLATAEELRTRFPAVRVEAMAADLSDKASARLFGEWAVGAAGTIDVLVNNTGTFTPGGISTEADGALEHMLGTNLFSAYHVTRAVLPHMMAAKSGHIFTICSIASLQAYPNGGAYSISKFALLGFNRNLREELKPHGIKVTSVLPGAVYTDSWNGSGVSEDRIMKPEDIAQLIYTASQLSYAATVEEIVVRPQLGDL
ncbi:SDR family oxidoreductase [Flaviaesturariibacter aridisoli]|uniref:SDR family oxidoreductase n=1 Tax=Flaviaesturariibacter aridisoli TaxID=2545761 RepID=A0A4R4DZU7_9BACT|nr:SDR family oxidoreductase [Flaviaesturariibacter aridisoli]TCZ72221.1 SDR family oxidoreductase [Flaviaesturariibacter aridisoli]